LSIYERFIPGQWLDNIDVNDFVNLNKKPFFEKPIFLENSTENTEKLFQKIKHIIENENWDINPDFSSLKDFNAEYIDKYLESIIGVPSKNLEKRMSYSENIDKMMEFYPFKAIPVRKENRKTSYELFDEVATSEIKKTLKMKLFLHTPTDHIPSFINPDVRKIALYGTKKLIKDKKMYLKTLEKHLQTHEWMERRIAIHREIDALRDFEKFAKLYKVNVTEPAENAKEAITFTYLSILASVIENPSISFSLTQVIPFLDIYIEHDLQNNLIKEIESQEYIEQFFLKLSLIRFVHSPKLVENHKDNPHFFGETFGGNLVTKSTYRFLHAVLKFHSHPFVIRVIWENSLPYPFREYCEKLLNKGIPVSFVNSKFLPDGLHTCLFSHGMNGLSGEDIMFDSGSCDLEKIFYLALNGGKDLSTNLNLTPVTQPTRKSEIEYDEAFSKLKDFLSYALSIYVELMNIVVYINETTNHHPLRSSLMSNLTYYKVQFGFFHLEKLIKILYSISMGKYEIKRDSGGWIEEIIPLVSKVENYEVVTAHLVTFIEKELAKIPLYKNGKAKIRIHQNEINEMTISNPFMEHYNLPPEYINATFHHSLFVQKNEQIMRVVENWFAKDFGELHLSTDIVHTIINGVYLTKKD